MVTIKTKIGQKGQIVIPKVFRDEYHISKKTELLLRDVGQGILIQKPHLDVAQEFARMARKQIRTIDFHMIEKQYEERMKRSGLIHDVH